VTSWRGNLGPNGKNKRASEDQGAENLCLEFPLDATEDGGSRAVRSPQTQLSNLFAGKLHGGAKFSVRELEFNHGLRLGYQ